MSKGDIWWWNENVRKDTHRVPCRNSTDENNIRYKSMKNKVGKISLKSNEKEG